MLYFFDSLKRLSYRRAKIIHPLFARVMTESLIAKDKLIKMNKIMFSKFNMRAKDIWRPWKAVFYV